MLNLHLMWQTLVDGIVTVDLVTTSSLSLYFSLNDKWFVYDFGTINIAVFVFIPNLNSYSLFIKFFMVVYILLVFSW